MARSEISAGLPPHDMTDCSDRRSGPPVDRPTDFSCAIPPPVLVPYRPLANPIRRPIGSRSEPQIAMSRRRRPCSREPIKGELQSREGNRRKGITPTRTRPAGPRRRPGTPGPSTGSVCCRSTPGLCTAARRHRGPCPGLRTRSWPRTSPSARSQEAGAAVAGRRRAVRAL